MRRAIFLCVVFFALTACDTNNENVNRDQLEASAERILVDYGIQADVTRLSNRQLANVISTTSGPGGESRGRTRALLRSAVAKEDGVVFCVPLTEACLVRGAPAPSSAPPPPVASPAAG